MEMTSTNVKRFFRRHFGIPVRCRTVRVERPFVQVWIESEPRTRFDDPMVYRHQFPPKLGNELLRIVYGPDTAIAFPAGNIRQVSISLSGDEWDQLVELYEPAAAQVSA
jgi:hypothetical protein